MRCKITEFYPSECRPKGAMVDGIIVLEPVGCIPTEEIHGTEKLKAELHIAKKEIDFPNTYKWERDKLVEENSALREELKMIRQEFAEHLAGRKPKSSDTAEVIAETVVQKKCMTTWDNLHEHYKKLYTSLVQAGMDANTEGRV